MVKFNRGIIKINELIDIKINEKQWNLIAYLIDEKWIQLNINKINYDMMKIIIKRFDITNILDEYQQPIIIKYVMQNEYGYVKLLFDDLLDKKIITKTNDKIIMNVNKINYYNLVHEYLKKCNIKIKIMCMAILCFGILSNKQESIFIPEGQLDNKFTESDDFENYDNNDTITYMHNQMINILN
jgi:hypothetical protein